MAELARSIHRRFDADDYAGRARAFEAGYSSAWPAPPRRTSAVAALRMAVSDGLPSSELGFGPIRSVQRPAQLHPLGPQVEMVIEEVRSRAAGVCIDLSIHLDTNLTRRFDQSAGALAWDGFDRSTTIVDVHVAFAT